MSINILDYKTLNIDNIVFDAPKKIKGGSYMAMANYVNDNKERLPIIIQTPRLKNSGGIVKNDNRCYTELELDKTHWSFYEFITDLDDHNIVIIEKNSSVWFNQDFPIDVVEEFYKTPVKLGRGKNPPKFKLKIPITKGNLTCEIYDNNKQHVLYNNVKDNSRIICVLQFLGLRFLKQQVICEWTPLQLKLCESSKTIMKNYLINDELLSDRETDLNKQTETLIENTTNDNREELNLEPIVEQDTAELITTESTDEPEPNTAEFTTESTTESTAEPTAEPTAEAVEIANKDSKDSNEDSNEELNSVVQAESELENKSELKKEVSDSAVQTELDSDNKSELIQEETDSKVIDTQEVLNAALNDNLEEESTDNKDTVIENLQKELSEKSNEIVNLKDYFKSIISKLNL